MSATPHAPFPDPPPAASLRGGPPQPGARRARLPAWFGRIGTRAALVAALMLAVVLLLSGTALITDQRQSDFIEQIGVRDREADAAVDELTQHVADFSAGFASVIAGVLQPVPAAPRMVRGGDQILRSFARVDALLGQSLDPILMGGGRDMAGRMPELVEQVRTAFAGRQRDRFGPLHEEWLDYMTTYTRIANAAREYVQRRGDMSLAEARELAAQARRIVLVATLLGLAGSGLILLVLVSLIARPLSRIARAMEALARGDLAAEVPETGRSDQLGGMARAVVVFKQSLVATHTLTEQAAENARRTAIATTQASDAIGQVSDGAMTQLAELRQVGDALSQTAEAIRDVVRSTALSSDRAQDSKALLDANLTKVRSLIGLVDAVSDDTERVTRIAGTISKIATQTNILAINAAIEAARAGEHGRGLAVVAEEVRALAASSEQLAQEIADVVLVAGRRTREGSGTAAAVGEDMDTLERLVAESARLSGAIAVAMEQQQATVTDIHARVGTLTRIGQSNATAAEEITVTMIDLAKLASETQSAVESMAGRSA
ncbi:methyl-accepting chemotaxis protein [Pseudoroseomonas cervicalis]|uniref:methyl-accepting chemotaxis protein n=1 Tax=Teichococcus cervicalis TaxID=204525 RepID=UPI0022F17530|nr:methyl-accepting chemotaxis protein [Pseudoroseomonas cervicalis]WBV42431.1 methyl-accepting chemotaxis protein [Pseudoroseomonas cervicalis]